MHRIWVAAGLAASILLCGAGVPANDPPPSWAFVILQKSHDARPPTGLATLPGSKLRVTQEKLDDRFDVPDWFPEDHAKPPAVVLHGRAPALSACGYCHLPTGVGSPEDAVIAGLPEAYIEEQIDEFRSGRRQCAVPAVIPCGVSMNKIARAVNEDEMKQMRLGLAHGLSRYKLKFSTEKVDTMIIQVILKISNSFLYAFILTHRLCH